MSLDLSYSLRWYRRFELNFSFFFYISNLVLPSVEFASSENRSEIVTLGYFSEDEEEEAEEAAAAATEAASEAEEEEEEEEEPEEVRQAWDELLLIQREQQRYSDIKYDLEQDLEHCKKKQSKLEDVIFFIIKLLIRFSKKSCFF